MKSYINLLPENYRRRRLLRRRLLQWTVVCAAVMAGALPLWAMRSHRLATEQATLRERREAYAPTQQMLQQIPQMQHEMRELSQRDEMVRQLHDDRPPLAALGMVSQAAAACKGDVRVFQLIADRPAGKLASSETTDKNAASAAPFKPATLTIQGTGVDNAAVARFVANLRKMQAFQSVDLRSSVRGRLALSDVQRFVVECEF